MDMRAKSKSQRRHIQNEKRGQEKIINSIKENKLWRLYGVTILIATGIFIALYFPYLSGQYLYAYSDIGSDTIKSYLPKIVFDIKNIFQGKFNVYTLQQGLGEYYDSYLYKYLNVVNLPLLLLGEEHIRWALLAATYLKYAVICFFALLFFRRLLRDDRLASICALLWTYSGYAVLWGQHYQFLTNTVFLTVAMYGIQLFLENDRKRFLLIPALASLAYTSYYWLYISGYLFAAYSIGYLVFRKAGAREILKKAGIFALSLILAVGIAGEYMFPAAARFFDSARTSDVIGENSEFLVYPTRYLLTFLARLLSNDTIGVGNSYSGTKNYYEAAILSVSVLFIFTLILLLQSKEQKRVAVCVRICAIALCLEPISQLLNFSVDNQRWSFIYCFLEIVVIGVGLRHLFHRAKQPDFSKILLRTVLIADGVYVFFLVILWFAQESYDIKLNTQACNLVVVFLILYSMLFLIVPSKERRWQYTALALLVSVELVTMNYRSVNERTRVTSDEWYNSMYYDGTAEVVDWIQDQDGSFYRINKSYDSIGYHDALVQGYQGMAVYNSVNSERLVNLYTSLGNSLVNGKYSNWIRFSADDDVTNTLMGVKYLIVTSDSEPNETMYKEIYRDGEFRVYENQFDLGFGYLYRKQMPQQQFEELKPNEKWIALAESYYLSDGETSYIDPISLEYVVEKDGIPYMEAAYNCEVEVRSGILYVYATGVESNDMQLIFNCENIPEGWSIGGVTVEMSLAEAATAQVFVKTDEQGYSQEQSVRCAAQAGENICYFDLSKFDRPIKIRFDPANLSQDVEIKSLTLELINEKDSPLYDILSDLRENRIDDFSQTGNTFTGSVTNPWKESAMLCIPLIYSDHWRVKVDGKAVEVQNINGGLVGIGVDPGFHEISITYHNNTQWIGRIVGLTSFLIYIAGAVIWWRRKGRYETPVDFYACAYSDAAQAEE